MKVQSFRSPWEPSRKEIERRALIKSLEGQSRDQVALGCVIGGVLGAIGGAFGGGIIAGPIGSVAGAAAGIAIGFHEGCAIGAATTIFAETIVGNIPQLRRLNDQKAMKKKAEAECKVEANNAVSKL